MKNSIGSSVILTLFGESHGEAVGAVLDGLAPGIDVDLGFIASQLEKRKGQAGISTSRRENDRLRIISGIFNGKTTGAPLTIIIENEDHNDDEYECLRFLPRPSHADYTAQVKYHGFQDYRGGGHFSGRITAGIVAAGSICLCALRKKGIYIGSHIKACGEIKDRDFIDHKADISTLESLPIPILDNKSRADFEKLITALKQKGDSIGGVLETAVIGLPAGVGEPWFDSLEGLLSHAVFSIPAVKGVEFGAGFGFGCMKGSQANDALSVQDGKVVTMTNNNGGINGGISNGMPIVFSTAFKPTPSVLLKQQTIDLSSMKDEPLIIQGRHDPTIVHRVAVVVDSMTAIVLCDALAQRFGTDYLLS